MNANLTMASAQDRAYDYVKAQILALSLRPGQWVKALEIAKEVGVSRTPVREALGRLEQEGFVRRDEGWGYVVESITLEEVHDLYKVREALEAEAARAAVPHVTPDDIEELEGCLQRAQQAADKGRIVPFRANSRAFHAKISALGRNALLVRMLAELEGRVQRFGGMVFERHPQRTREVLQENRAILDALAKGSVSKAEQAARAHVQRAWESFLKYVAPGVGLSSRISPGDTRRKRG